MHIGKIVFSQVIEHLPMHTFRRCVQRYDGNHKIKSFSCLDQFLCMAFAQLTYRESLRDIEACLRAQREKLYHMGIRGGVSRNTLANANKVRDWRIYADFAQALIKIARPLYAEEDLGLDLDNTVYALDASTIDLCLSVFPWALFRSTKSAVKLHTLLDLRGNIPTFIHISDGKLHDVNVLDILIPEPGSFYIMDRGYLDFGRLFSMDQAGAFFVIRAKCNTVYQRRYSHPISSAAQSSGVKCDQTIVLTGINAKDDYPQPLRRIKYHDNNTGKTFNFLTNNFTVPAQTVADLYRYRWQVELFFKWIKQHLRIKAFYGTSENAVKSQVWMAILVYVLVAIIKKQLKLETELYTILQILSLTLFEKTPLDQLLMMSGYKNEECTMDNQLNLFGLTLGH
ncbi:MAG: IS4 family transposase [Thiogranum sp.]